MNNHWMVYENEVLGRGVVVDKDKSEVVLGVENYEDERFVVDFMSAV